MDKKGYIHVYTGTGKGKTTAALGLALRSWGHGKRVCIIQFMKGNEDYGEHKASLKLGKDFLIRHFGRGVFIIDKPTTEDKKLAKKGLDFAKKILSSNKYDLIVLDEINCALHWGLLSNKDVRGLLEIKPANLELVLTGRYAPQWLIKKADLVTEMKERKHYFKKGVKARLGIEY